MEELAAEGRLKCAGPCGFCSMVGGRLFGVGSLKKLATPAHFQFDGIAPVGKGVNNHWHDQGGGASSVVGRMRYEVHHGISQVVCSNCHRRKMPRLFKPK